MEPPEDGKLNWVEELHGESLPLSKPGNNDYSLDKEGELRLVKRYSDGYRNGIVAGEEAIAQESYNFGYKESVLAAYRFGIVRGVSSALAFLPDELREKLIDEQEIRDKFQKLHNSLHALSTQVAMKLFYGVLSGSGSSVNATTDLGSYVSELSFLLGKSPKIQVNLETEGKN